MIDVLGVKFKKLGKIYYVKSEGTYIEKGTNVLVETIRGLELGIIERSNFVIEEEKNLQPIKKIIRIATKEDLEKHKSNVERENEALEICFKKIKEHKLDMKLIDVELTFDCSKIIFYFTSDGRVDFRNLVKDLAYIFKMRIELRQIGVRDEAKMLNSIGICGKTLCCSTFLTQFEPVSIKMAKEQNLSLNPGKISGVCGRLMCCLKYEEDTYLELNEKLPKEGDIVNTKDGSGVVLSVNVLKETVKVGVNKNDKEGPIIDYYNVKDIEIIRHKKQKDDIQLDDELKKLID